MMSTGFKQSVVLVPPWVEGHCVGPRRRLLLLLRSSSARPRVEVPTCPRPLTPFFRYQARGKKWRPAFAFNADSAPTPDPDLSPDGDDNSPFGTTRLGTLVRAAASQLLSKLNSARKNFPMKVFLLLLGFYTANALATILGQTGDWDVLVAGMVVAAIEGIGMLMYGKKKPVDAKMVGGRLQKLIEMVNYWKAGVCLGLFVDAFKLGS